jgi:hypothetical protein
LILKTKSFIFNTIIKFNFIWLYFAYFVTFFYLVKNFYHYRKKNTILVLNSDRFHSDLNILKKVNKFNFLHFPSSLHYLISAPFVSIIKNDLIDNDWWDITQTKKWNNYIKKHAIFIAKYSIYLKKLYNIKAIITPSFYYFQDQAWEKANSISNIPYLVFFRESFKDHKSIDFYITRYSERNYKFKGTSIFVYNEFEKSCLIKSKTCNSDQVKVLGSPRFDKIISKIDENNIQKGSAITLFSFRHTIASYKLDRKTSNDGFSNNGEGAIKLFDTVHGEFANQAILNPEVIFYIKLKFFGSWKNYVDKAIKNYTNINSSDIPNLHIIQKTNPQNLIAESSLVIGINSTALVESRILGKKTAVPVFEEAKESLKEYIYLDKFFGNEIYEIKSILDFKNLIKECISEPFTIKNIKNKNIVTDYIGFYDTDHTDRYIKEIEKIMKLHSKDE